MIDKFAEGEAVGEARGEARGRIDEKYGIAKNLLKSGVDVKIVIDTTGLTHEEIKKIKAIL